MSYDEDAGTKKSRILYVLGVVLVPIAIVLMAGAAILQELGLLETEASAVIAFVFLGCLVISVIFLIKSLPDIVVSDIKRINETYNEWGLFEMQLTDKKTLEQKIIEKKYKCMQDGYLAKRGFSLLEIYIHYYVRIIDGVELESSIRREADRLNASKKAGGNCCLILFVYLDEVSESEKQYVGEVQKNCIISEIEKNLTEMKGLTFIVVAVDSDTNMGYFLDINTGKSAPLYAHGCREIKSFC